MSEQTVESFEEWAAYADETDEPRARAVGVLADEVRARVGANKHVPVWLSEEIEQDGRGCSCCTEYYKMLVVECGDEAARLNINFDEDADEVRETYLDWLDEPRRRAEREAAQRARREAAQAQERRVVDSLTSALTAVEAEGYRNDGEWHDKVMDALGVKGVRYGS